MTKRTIEQRNNLRMALVPVLGPYAIVMTDEALDEFVDKLQEHINNLPEPFKFWIIRVKIKENENLDWNQIQPNQTILKCSLKKLQNKAHDLLKRYSDLIAIQAVNNDDPKELYVFKRNESEKKLTKLA